MEQTWVQVGNVKRNKLKNRIQNDLFLAIHNSDQYTFGGICYTE